MLKGFSARLIAGTKACTSRLVFIMSRSEADVIVTEHVVKALVDGFPLAISIRRPPSNVAISNAVVIIAAATGVPAAAYVGFVE